MRPTRRVDCCRRALMHDLPDELPGKSYGSDDRFGTKLQHRKGLSVFFVGGQPSRVPSRRLEPLRNSPAVIGRLPAGTRPRMASATVGHLPEVYREAACFPKVSSSMPVTGLACCCLERRKEGRSFMAKGYRTERGGGKKSA